MKPALAALLIALALILAPPAVALAETVAGPARVIDGDTLEISGERVRILDIDAPETRQTCTTAAGVEWRCGSRATLDLAAMLGDRAVICAADRRDRYGRLLATCRADGLDVALWLAEAGLAVPYRDCACETIRAAAGRARAARLGIWSGAFVLPWEWRKAN